MRGIRLRAILLASSALVSAALPTTAHAVDATWLAAPANGNFNNAVNWNPATPDGTATFGASNTTAIDFTQPTFLGGLLLNANAANYSFTIGANGLVSFSGDGVVINGGSVTLNNPNADGILRFLASSTAGAATINNDGSLTFADAGTAGTARINSQLQIDFFDTSSADRSTITGGVGIQFHQSSTAANATITSDGTINFLQNATAANATITSSGRVFFFNSSSGGTARFVIDNGAFDISFLTTTGTTVGSIEGTGTVALGDRALTVGSNNLSTTFAGVIGASITGGSLIKQGTGTLTLSGANTYSGPTLVNGGTLAVDGSIGASFVTVNTGGTLAGSGTVGDTTVAGGTLAPGGGATAIGTLTVQGNAPANLSFTAASTYLIQVSPANASRTNVTGTATLGGATVAANFAPGSYVTKQYTILHAAGGVSGTFGALTNTNLPTNFESSLSYDANNVFLNLKLGLLDFGNGLSVNQRNVANALINSFNTAGGIPLVFGALSPAGLTQISGETATGTQQATFHAMNMFMGLMTDPNLAGRGGPATPASGVARYADDAPSSRSRVSDAFAAISSKAPLPAELFTPRWSIWAAGFGGSQNTDGDDALSSNKAASRIFGAAAGADYHFSPSTVAGFALAGGGTNFNVTNSGSGSSDLFQLGAFFRHNQGAAYVDAALAYGWQDVTTNRTLNIAGADQLRARFNTNAFSGRIEAGYRFSTQVTDFTPYAAGQFTTFSLPSYSEQVVFGTNTFALAYNSKDVTATRSEIGLRTENAMALGDTTLALRSRLAWAHDFNRDRNVAAVFQALPGSAFVVNGARPAADSALTTASAEIIWRNGWSATAAFEGEFSAITRSYAGKGGIRYSW
ncbi:autotransporter outer membrane beta-barrel domain-containing protein [Bradyrhizobium sediminis]|uniref:autotransporter outer membrane beta-barrel domain-containing protein n=1 Tax=Bradyrhizobium sediminis TaxID=2840469 RepID=UPI00201BA2ED|nr:autotransporter domain-containing protein [Bradyrhizobium sediminis]